MRLRRYGSDLYVELLGEASEAGARPGTDSMRVYRHYSRASAKIETIEFADGTVWGDDRVVDSSGTDKVQVSGHRTSGLSFSRQGDDMAMEAIGSGDRAAFDHWYAEGGSRKVERMEVGDQVMLSTAAERMATAMAAFITGGGTASDFVSRNHQDYWEAITGTPGG